MLNTLPRVLSPAVLLNIKTNHESPRELWPGSDVHGLSYQHRAYDLAIVPSKAFVDPVIPANERTRWKPKVHIAKSSNLVPGLLALIQLCFSIFVLVRARGNQIEIYGYGAFSLTVAPYAVMGAVNLLANALMPTYNSLYLVRNDVMEEIENHSSIKFDGVVGIVRQAVSDHNTLHQIARAEDGVRYVTEFEPDDQSTTREALTIQQAIDRREVPVKEFTVEGCGKTQCEASQPWLYAFST
jgi:hypothetical protein